MNLIEVAQKTFLNIATLVNESSPTLEEWASCSPMDRLRNKIQHFDLKSPKRGLTILEFNKKAVLDLLPKVENFEQAATYLLCHNVLMMAVAFESTELQSMQGMDEIVAAIINRVPEDQRKEFVNTTNGAQHRAIDLVETETRRNLLTEAGANISMPS